LKSKVLLEKPISSSRAEVYPREVKRKKDRVKI
jgi:hypothetical protein